MLQLINIRKSYTTAGFTQNALDGVSLTFRENEFTAILGPSGSGKTTMLNIIGGLDQYDSGDLVIDNISTKKYKDRDWDTYRNNRIGFVFQSYNLITHQSVLSNVELALTLSGVSKSERKARAIKALEEVGLEEHMRKKPSQLSGGQMQRVAIARALVNNPEILLADEPTGALDSKTSEQVMELLTKIAKDRLVIMVTHNGELAEEYANRIVYLRDGEVVSDSRPCNPSDEKPQIGRTIRKSSMSFLTAISLSFSNLMTKKGRTFVTSLAGSIGIIGIAAILALANGINAYIQRIEEETLSLYPLTIQSSGFDISGMFANTGDSDQDEARRDIPPDSVREIRIVDSVFTSMSINDLESLKAYFEEINQEIHSHVTFIQYLYDITPQIYLADTSQGVDRVSPDEIFSDFGMMGADAGGMGMGMGFGGMSGMNIFSEMPEERSLFENQYDVLAGRWPENYDKAVIVLSQGGTITDFELYGMGLRDRSELRSIVDSFMTNSEFEVEIVDDGRIFSHDTLMDLEFRIVNPADFFQYDDTFNVWVDRSGDAAFMRSLVYDSLPLQIVGIVQPNPGANITILSSGINYTPALITHLMEQAANTQIVMEQLAHPEVNVISGRTFEDERENPESEFDFSRIITVDEEMIEGLFDFEELDEMEFNPDDFDFDMSGIDFDASSFNFNPSDFNFDMSSLNLDLSNIGDLNLNLDFSTIDFSSIPPPQIDMDSLVQILVGMNVQEEDINAIVGIMIGAMLDFIVNNPTLFMPQNPPITQDQINSAFMAYLIQNDIITQLTAIIDSSELEAELIAAFSEFMMATMQTYMMQVMGVVSAQIEQAMAQVMQQLMTTISTQMQQAMEQIIGQIITSITRQMERAMTDITEEMTELIAEAIEEIITEMMASMEEMMDFDEDAFAEAFQITMGEDEVFDLMTSIMNPTERTLERNLSILGYANPNAPSQINIYPINFESNAAVLDILEDYNARMEANGESERVVRFIDFVGVMMSSVTQIVDLVSYGLIAFVSISLVVSSIMIGVITFISVLERKKEIGILRAIGASKQNIRRVFNAETLIIGFVAGVLGVLITLIFVAIANIIIYNGFDIENLAQLPTMAAVILVGVSMFLTFIAGLMPASAAARKNPVEALRSE